MKKDIIDIGSFGIPYKSIKNAHKSGNEIFSNRFVRFLYMYSSASSYRKKAKAASWGDREAIKERKNNGNYTESDR